MPLADRLRAAGTRSGPLLGAAILLQWLSTLVVALRARPHRLALRAERGCVRLHPGRVRRSSTETCLADGPGILWPIVLSPFASVADTIDGVLAGAVLLNVLVLGSVALVAAYWIAARIGGRLLGVATVALWVAAPWLLLMLALEKYDPVVRDRVLPLVLGLTAEPAFPAAVALVVLRRTDLDSSLDRRSLAGAALAGLVAGAAVAIEPHSLLFLGGAAARTSPPAAFPRRARSRSRSRPAVLAIALWQARALDGPDPLAFGPVDWDQFTINMAGLREFFWSQRLLQWLPLAGTIAVARRSVPLALLLGGWMISFGVVLGSQPEAVLDGGAHLPGAATRPAGLRPARGGDSAARPDTRRQARHEARSDVTRPPARPKRAGGRRRRPRSRAAGDRRVRGKLALVALADPPLEQRELLREDHVLVGELGDHRRVVQQHREDEERRDREEHGRWVAGDAEPAGDRVQAATPRGEDEQDEPRWRARAARSARAACGCGSARGRRG